MSFEPAGPSVPSDSSVNGAPASGRGSGVVDSISVMIMNLAFRFVLILPPSFGSGFLGLRTVRSGGEIVVMNAGIGADAGGRGRRG